MKKVFLIILLIAAVAAIALAFGGESQKENVDSPASYLRVHIRANSNGDADQAVKYKVRDGVVEYLTPTIAGCESKQEALTAVTRLLPAIERVAERILSENGYSYGACARLTQENFPTRVYDGVTLEEGEYDALIIELGEGSGDNWWCVLYPPLCFTSASADVQYRSLIKDIIDNFFKRD